MDWSKYKYFKESEFVCSHTGRCDMKPQIIEALENIRHQLGFPLIISSGYRDMTHPKEAIKPMPGEHTTGLAADILISGRKAIDLIHAASEQGITRIGVSQKGDMASRFIHLGMGDWFYLSFPSGLWSY